MSVLVTCTVFVLLSGSMMYFIYEEKGVKVRKKLNILEVHFARGPAFIFWTISFLLNTFFTLDNYIRFLSNTNSVIVYPIASLVFSSLLLISFYLERWKVLIYGDKIIKYGMFTKKAFDLSDITQIKETWFGNKYYIKNRKLFSTSSRYHNYSRAFEIYIKDRAQNN